jgi:hypothetical protein
MRCDWYVKKTFGKRGDKLPKLPPPTRLTSLSHIECFLLPAEAKFCHLGYSFKNIFLARKKGTGKNSLPFSSIIHT